MRFSSIVIAVLVTVTLYLLIFQREELLAFAAGDNSQETGEETVLASAETEAPAEDSEAPTGVPVVAMSSLSKEIEQIVLLRGRTEAARTVEVRAETAGSVVSDPLRKGAFVTAGDALCEIDPGTRNVSLSEAEARLAEARAALPAARASQAQAEAQLPAAEAAILEARARVPEAKANLLQAEAGVPTAEANLAQAQASIPAAEANLAQAKAGVPTAEARLAEALASVPTAEANLAQAEASVPAAEASLAQARAGLPAAEAAVVEARARIEEAEINLEAARRLSDNGFASQTRVAGAVATSESAKAGLQSALSALEGAKASVQNALSAVEGAKASVQAAKGQVESAKAAVVSARGQVESAKAAVESAKQQIESAKASVQSAKGQVESAKAAVQSAKSGVESASAGVASALSAQESAKAAVESAKSGVESALAGIGSAETAVASAQKEIDRLTIHAPFAGLLETDTAELGSLLQNGGLCATVIQLDPIKLVAFIPETQVDKVELGAMAGARLASGGTEVIGKVAFLSRSADSTTRTFRVEIEVPNADLKIRDGQTVQIAIQADRQVAHLIPQSALTLDDEGVLGVRTVEDGNVVGFHHVEILRDAPEGVYVSGLGEEADVIIVGQEYVTEGVTVAPTFRDTSK